MPLESLPDQLPIVTLFQLSCQFAVPADVLQKVSSVLSAAGRCCPPLASPVGYVTNPHRQTTTTQGFQLFADFGGRAAQETGECFLIAALLHCLATNDQQQSIAERQIA